jgi:hypothetical protein
MLPDHKARKQEATVHTTIWFVEETSLAVQRTVSLVPEHYQKGTIGAIKAH